LRKFWNNYFYFRQVRRQNQEMRDEIFFLRQENQVLKNLLLKYKGGREIQELLATISRSILVGSVIGFDSSEIYKSVVLNKGSLDGVKKDMVVLDKRGRLVGRVIPPISLKQSRVQLITDEASGVGVVSERFKVVGILTGNAGGKCSMKYVLKTNKEIEAGEEVSTSGFDGLYPSGIPVGKIISCNEDATLFKKIIVEPYFDFSELDLVAVITVDLKGLS
jgi:rod shape-determining protein MreC